ncbi:MAG TPA: ABC transporter substrate-binding protein [Candidatus Dormibacteraeota bacterium]|jgi:ABC-type branched-subunit amino acid transport system substrate-binding protein|nr:ABC transporter substrate-binding protein [Candidatus Dormibacteraeota bacterium]
MKGRERTVIVLMTVSLLATLGLGSAAAYALTHAGSATVSYRIGSGAAAEAGATPAASAAATGVPGAPTPGSSAAAASSGGGTTATNVSNGGSAGSAAVPGINNSQNFVHNGVITVGGIFDESGPLDATVERDTVRAYFDQVNAAGGVNGSKLQLIDCDSAFNPSTAHSCSQRLLSQGVLAIVGWTSVSGEQTEAPYLDTQTASCPQCGIPIFGGLGVDAEFQSPLSFPVADSLGRQGYAGATRLCALGYQHAAVVYLTASFAASVNGGILKGLATCGQHPTGNDDVAVDIANQQDYSSIVTPWLADGTKSVLPALDPFSMARLYQAMERDQFNPPMIGAGLDKTGAEGAYGSNFKGVQSFTPVLEPVGHTDNPAMADYLNTVKQYYPSQVSHGNLDVYTEEQWIAAHVFVAALRAIKGPVTRAALVSAAQSLSNFDTGGLTRPLTYGHGGLNDPNHWVQWMHNPTGKADGWVTDSDWVDIPYNPS